MNSNNKKYIFIIGSGCSGNSAVTDWLEDNSNSETSVFSGDFEELREKGAIIDAFLSHTNNFFSLNLLKFLIFHNVRLVVRFCYFSMKGKPLPKNSWQIRNSIKRYLRRVALCNVLNMFSDYEFIKKYLVVRHLASLSPKKIIVLNNPLFVNKETFQFINSLGINYEVVFTYRNFALQYQEWQRLDYDGVNEPRLLELNKINDPFKKFEAFQAYILSQRMEVEKIAKVQYVSFDRFVIDRHYRSKIWFKIFGSEIKSEKFDRFNPTSSRLNALTDVVSLSAHLELIAEEYNARS